MSFLTRPPALTLRKLQLLSHHPPLQRKPRLSWLSRVGQSGSTDGHNAPPCSRLGWRPGARTGGAGWVFIFPSPTPEWTNAPAPRKQWPGSSCPRVTYHSSLPRAASVLARKVPHPEQHRAVDYPRWSPNFLRTPPPTRRNQLSPEGFLHRGSQPSKGGLGGLLGQTALGSESPVLPVRPIMASDRSLGT